MIDTLDAEIDRRLAEGSAPGMPSSSPTATA